MLKRIRCDESETELSNDMQHVSNEIVSRLGVHNDISTQNGPCELLIRKCWTLPKHFLALTVTSRISLIER